MPNDLLSTLLGRIEQPKLPEAPKQPITSTEMPMNWTLQESYGKVRDFDPTLTKSVKKVMFGPTTDQAVAHVNRDEPGTVVLNEWLDPMSLLRLGFKPVPNPDVNAQSLPYIMAHEARHTRDLADPKLAAAPRLDLERNAEITEREMLMDRLIKAASKSR